MTLENRALDAYADEVKRRQHRGMDSYAKGMAETKVDVERWARKLGAQGTPQINESRSDSTFNGGDDVSWDIDIDFVVEHLSFSGNATFGPSKKRTLKLWLAKDDQKRPVDTLSQLGQVLKDVG